MSTTHTPTRGALRRPLGPRTLALFVSSMLVLALTLAGCADFRTAIGSGKLVTREYDLTGITKVRVETAFKVTIARGDTSHATVTTDDNLVEHLRVELDGDTLIVGLRGLNTGWSATHEAQITLPLLRAVEARDIARVTVEGFESQDRLTLRVADAGSVSLVDVAAGEVDIEVSDTAQLSGGLETRVLSGRVSDVAKVSLHGSAAATDVAVSDIARFDLQPVADGTRPVGDRGSGAGVANQ